MILTSQNHLETMTTNPPSPAVRIPSLPEVYRTIEIPRGGVWWKRFLAFLGPGYLVSVGYMDPGNWATDIAGGSKFGYTLLSVILLSNLMAILLQALAARLGIATDRDLAQACRATYSRPVNLLLWLACEAAIIACDLAEVIGTAIALKLLFGIPLIGGALIAALDAFLLLLLMNKGFRFLEAFVISLLIVIAICFAVQIFAASPCRTSPTVEVRLASSCSSPTLRRAAARELSPSPSLDRKKAMTARITIDAVR
jgi:manganese transport protein